MHEVEHLHALSLGRLHGRERAGRSGMLAPVQFNDVSSARAAMAHLQQQASARAVPLRPPPPEPTTCCGRGCHGCVWEGYFGAVQFWLEDAAAGLGNSTPCGYSTA